MTTITNTRAKVRSTSSAETLRLLRQIHLYFGLLITPALLFFAFTGAMQTLSLHEAAGSSYKPPAWLAVWGQIHKKQTWMLPARRPAGGGDHREGDARANATTAQTAVPTRPDTTPSGNSEGVKDRANGPKFSAAAPTSGAAASSGPQQAQTLSTKQKQHLPLKLFFLVVSLGLFTSTLTGIYMAYKYDRNKLLVTGLLLAGVVIPLALLPF